MAFRPIGVVVSYLLLAVLFFLIIGPVAVLVRLFATDPMQRSYDRQAQSYWTDVQPDRDRSSYFRQF